MSTAVSANTALLVIDQVLESNFSCFLAALTNNADPVTFKQAAQHDHWVDATDT